MLYPGQIDKFFRTLFAIAPSGWHTHEHTRRINEIVLAIVNNEHRIVEIELNYQINTTCFKRRGDISNQMDNLFDISILAGVADHQFLDELRVLMTAWLTVCFGEKNVNSFLEPYGPELPDVSHLRIYSSEDWLGVVNAK